MEEWTIGEVARQTGVATSTLRYYESVGLLKPARRVSGQRRYRPEVVQQMAVLQLAQHVGFTIAEMRMLVNGFAPPTPASERWRLLAQQKLVEVRQRIEHAQQMQAILEHLLQCGCLRLEDCVARLQTDRTQETLCTPK
jgi:MerR family transcriptional regulator, redox-sensitive transcriptional activator SoxR